MWIAAALWVGTAMFVYFMAELPIIGMFVGLAVVLTAVVLGFEGAVIGTCLGMPTHLLFMSLGGAGYTWETFDPALFLGHGLASLFAFCIGWTRSLRERLERETDKRVASERARLEAQLESQLLRTDRLTTVGTMAGGVAHEINNPLTYMLSTIELLRLRAADPDADAVSWAELDEDLADIEHGAQRIEGIIRNLELFIGEANRSFEDVALDAVAETALMLTRHELGARVELELCWGSVPTIHGDPGRIAQVFVNLLHNAIQAIPGGEAGRIVVELGTEGEQVVASISDNGVGMSAQQRARAFDPFFTNKAVGMGTGLGLPVCASIMREHGGALELDSELGVGTTARLRFPSA